MSGFPFELYDRLIELAFDIEALCIELEGREYIYPDFEEWVYKGDYTIHTALQKSPGGQGYIITRRGLEHMLCNIANIGAIKRKGKIIYNHHEPIIDEGRFWLVYDNLKIARPDGTPTGKPVFTRFTQQRNLRAASVLKPLLKPETTHESGAVYFTRSGMTAEHPTYGSYTISVRRGLVYDCLICVNAEQLESTVICRMFEHLRTADLGDLKAARIQRAQRKAERLEKIARDLGVIEEELANLKINLKKLTIDAVIKETEASMARILIRKQELLDEREQTYLAHGEGGRKQWEEEELARLCELYPGERDRFAIMRAFPDRSWRAIRHMADNLGLTAGKGQGKGRGIRFKRDRLEYDVLSWRDLCWLEQSGLSARSLFSNEEGWLSSLS